MKKLLLLAVKTLKTIAGFDVMTTQLDLARAYIETGRKNLAKNILNNVMLHGTADQQLESEAVDGNIKL